MGVHHAGRRSRHTAPTCSGCMPQVRKPTSAALLYGPSGEGAYYMKSPVAAFIKASLRARNMGRGPEVDQEIHGYRHQFNIADSSFGWIAGAEHYAPVKWSAR